MLLDDFKLHSVTLQMTYAERYELWDCAGAISRELSNIWPGLSLEESRPNNQLLQTDQVKLETALTSATATFFGGKGFDSASVDQLVRTFAVWRDELGLDKVTRLSCRSRYIKDFPTRRAANERMLSWGLCRIPTGRVFDQPQDGDGNSVEVNIRFEDASSFAVVRAGAEHVVMELKGHPDLTSLEGTPNRQVTNRVFVDFDRGVLGMVDLREIRIGEWLKGYQHLLRRDIDKVIGAGGRAA